LGLALMAFAGLGVHAPAGLDARQHPAGQTREKVAPQKSPKKRGPHEQQDKGALVVGRQIDRQLGRDQSHTYALRLHTGDYLHVTIAQRGIDLAATLIRPDGRDLLTVDACDDDFREEAVVVIADAEGTYRLIVRPVASTAPNGRYSIQV